MPHWKSLNIERFRRLENLRLDGLGAVNILVGKNNSGKTSVLEALAVMSDPFSPFNWINTAWERELKSARTPVLEVLSWMFPQTAPRKNGYEGTAVIEAIRTNDAPFQMAARYHEFRDLTPPPEAAEPREGNWEEPSEYSARLEVSVKDHFMGLGQIEESSTHEIRGGRIEQGPEKRVIQPHQFVSPVSHRTSRQLLAVLDQVLQERRKEEVVRLMQMFAEDVDDIEIRSPQGRGAVVYLHHRGIGHVPLPVEGDGMRRALAFAAAATLARDGVLLLDEVETALHPDALGRIFQFLVQVCRTTSVQLFVSTHSLEAVDAMLVSVAGDVADLVAYRLPTRGSDHPIKRFGGQTLHDLRNEGGMDLR